MLAILAKILGFIVPPDPCPWELLPGADPEKVEEAKRAMRRWHLGMAGILGLCVVGFAVMTFTPYGFAYAGDSKEEIAAEVKPIKDSVSKIEGKLNENEQNNRQVVALLNELKAATVIDDLDRLIKRRCRETDPDELRVIRRAIQDGKELYKTLRGGDKQYDEPSCAELIRG